METEDQGFAIVPATGEGYVELAAAASTATRAQQGRVFRKQVLKYGDLRYKGQKVKIDDAFADSLVRNFHDSSVTDIVHAPKAGPRNEHNDDPDRNVGEIIDVIKNERGVFVDIDVRTDDADKMGKTLLGASALLHLNYENRNTGEKVGPTLLHTCITNRPYVTDLEPFEEVLAMSAEGVDINSDTVVLTADDPEENIMPTKEEALEVLGLSADTDVDALKADAEAYVSLTTKIKDAFGADPEVLALSAGEDATVENFIQTVENAQERIVGLSAEVGTLTEEKLDAEAETEVDKLVLTGFVLPHKKEAALRHRKLDAENFRDSLPERPLIKLSVEEGDNPVEIPGKTAQDEIDRLSALQPSAASA